MGLYGTQRNCVGMHRGTRTSQNYVDGTGRKNIFTGCPFGERSCAKDMGARWDPRIGYWYITQDMDASQFRRWLPSNDYDTSEDVIRTDTRRLTDFRKDSSLCAAMRAAA